MSDENGRDPRAGEGSSAGSKKGKQQRRVESRTGLYEMDGNSAADLDSVRSGAFSRAPAGDWRRSISMEVPPPLAQPSQRPAWTAPSLADIILDGERQRVSWRGSSAEALGLVPRMNMAEEMVWQGRNGSGPTMPSVRSMLATALPHPGDGQQPDPQIPPTPQPAQRSPEPAPALPVAQLPAALKQLSSQIIVNAATLPPTRPSVPYTPGMSRLPPEPALATARPVPVRLSAHFAAVQSPPPSYTVRQPQSRTPISIFASSYAAPQSPPPSAYSPPMMHSPTAYSPPAMRTAVSPPLARPGTLVAQQSPTISLAAQHFQAETVESVRFVPYGTETVVDTHVESTILRPQRTEVRTHNTVRDVPVYIDTVVEQPVEVEVPVFVEKRCAKTITLSETVQRPQPYEVLRPLPSPREVPLHLNVEVPQAVVVEKRVTVDRVVEKRVEVERTVERRVEVPVERIVDVDVHVDRVVEVDVPRVVDVPYRRQVQVECITHQEAVLPQLVFEEVELPRPFAVPEPVEIVEEVPVATEVSVEQRFEFIVAEEQTQTRQNALRVQRAQLVPQPQPAERTVTVEVRQEELVERHTESQLEVLVEVERVVEKPVYNTRVVEVFVPKVVERRVHLPREKYFEVPVYTEVEQVIELKRVVRRPRVRQETRVKTLHSAVSCAVIADGHRAEFEQLSEQATQLRLDNARLAFEVAAAEETRNAYLRLGPSPAAVEEECRRLQAEVEAMRAQLGESLAVNAQLKSQSFTHIETQTIDAFSSVDITTLYSRMKTVESGNDQLRSALTKIGLHTLRVEQGQVRSVSPPFSPGKAQSGW